MPSRLSTALGFIALLGPVALLAWHPAVPPAEERLVIPIPALEIDFEGTLRPPGCSSLRQALPWLWSRSLLRRMPNGTVVGDLAESWNKTQTTWVAIDPKGKLPDGRPFSLAAVRGYMARLGGRENEFLKSISAIDVITDRQTLVDALRPYGLLRSDSPWREVYGKGTESVCVLKISLETWDADAGTRIREILGAALVPLRHANDPEPVHESRCSVLFRLRALKHGTEPGVTPEPSENSLTRDAWRSCEDQGGTPEYPPESFFPRQRLAVSTLRPPVAMGPFDIIRLLANGGILLERLADAPEADLPPDLLLPAREEIPLGGTRPLPEFATLVETPPNAWPPPGVAANREELGRIRRPGHETAAVIFDATARLLEEPEIRRGLAGSIRREHLLQEVYRGRGRLVDSLLDPSDVALEPLPTVQALDNPVAAGKAFGEAGFTRTDSLPGAGLSRNGVPLAVDLVVPDDRPDLAAVAAQVARDWMSAGVQVRIIFEDDIPKRWTAPEGTPRAFVRAVVLEETPLSRCGNTPKLRDILKVGHNDLFPVLGKRDSSLVQAFAEEVSGVPLCRPDREFRIVPAPPETPLLNNRLAEVIDALPPPAPATDGARDPLPPFLR